MDQNKIPLDLTFDDVLLEPRLSHVLRGQVSLETKVTKKLKIDLPLLSAAMDTVSEESLAIALGRLGGVAVLHRNCAIEKQVSMVKSVKRHKFITAAAVGSSDFARVKALNAAGCDIIIVDHAHAHVAGVIRDAKKIKKLIRGQLVVGNIATKEAAAAFVSFADALKVGVGPGSICTTRIVAGVGVPQLTAILEVVKIAAKKNVPVIADGGIKYSGDAVKALAAGASSVMLGSMFAGSKEAPGRLVKKDGQLFKEYRGMGSLGAMKSGKSSDRYFQNPDSREKKSGGLVPEGVEALTPYKGPIADIVEQLSGGIRSGMGYIGAASIADMPKQARFIQITAAGLKESHPHSVFISKKAPNYNS